MIVVDNSLNSAVLVMTVSFKTMCLVLSVAVALLSPNDEIIKQRIMCTNNQYRKSYVRVSINALQQKDLLVQSPGTEVAWNYCSFLCTKKLGSPRQFTLNRPYVLMWAWMVVCLYVCDPIMVRQTDRLPRPHSVAAVIGCSYERKSKRYRYTVPNT